ncbi:MAG: MAPEG family protein [Pseudomonadota bacterium]
MATELVQLLLAVLLAFAHFAVYGVVANIQLGVTYTAGPRDEPPKGLSTNAHRLKRSYENYLETLPWFAIAVVVANLSGKADQTVHAYAWIYLAARIIYVPAYIVDIPYTRSAVWSVATLMILLITIHGLL